MISMLKINLHKSGLIPIGDISNMEDLARIFRLQGRYFANHLFPTRFEKGWKNILRKRLVLWKRQCLLNDNVQFTDLFYDPFCHLKEGRCDLWDWKRFKGPFYRK